jgi:hypothetical protein
VTELTTREFERLPLEVKVAVLYERVDNMGSEVHAMKRALWGVVFSIVLAVLVFALSVTSGVIGGR